MSALQPRLSAIAQFLQREEDDKLLYSPDVVLSDLLLRQPALELQGEMVTIDYMRVVSDRDHYYPCEVSISLGEGSPAWPMERILQAIGVTEFLGE